MPTTGEFLWDVEKLFADVVFQRMSFRDKGVYLCMLFREWLMKEKSLPDSAAAVAELIAVTDAQTTEVEAAWETVRRKFVTDRRGSGRIYNIKLEKTRRVQAKKFLEMQNRASIAGKASAAKRLQTHELPVNGRSTDVEPLSTVRLGKVRSGEERRGEEGIPAPLVGADARSKRPIFSGQRVTVFEWQLTNLAGILGPHLDAFDVHAWFFALDAQCVADGTVAPKRDGGAWLESALVREAQRRGLPLKFATPAPAHKRIAAAVTGGQAFLQREGK